MTRMKDASLQANSYTYNSVINAFARRGDVEQGEVWFAEMLAHGVKPTIVSYTSLLNACANSNDTLRPSRREDADRIFRDCIKHGVRPNQITMRTLDRIFGKERKTATGRQTSDRESPSSKSTSDRRNNDFVTRALPRQVDSPSRDTFDFANRAANQTKCLETKPISL